MGLLSYMRSVVDQNVVMRCMTVLNKQHKTYIFGRVKTHSWKPVGAWCTYLSSTKCRPAEPSYQPTELTVQHTDCHQHRNAPSPQCQHDSKDCIQSARLRNWCLWPPRSLVATVTCVIPVPVTKVNRMPKLGTQQCPFRRFRKFAKSDY